MSLTGSRQIRFIAFLCAFALAGCGGGGHSTGGDGYATFMWSIYDIEDANYAVPLACAEVGASTVVVTLTSSAGSYPQDPVSCAAMQMSTANVPAGSYTVGFDLYGDC